jgi:putative FmdB family regulatory protein
MPTYEYRCERGHNFDVLQRMSDDPVEACTVCGAPVQRVFHPVAVHFKGSGFYNTDYGTRKRAREKEGAESKSDGAAAKSDSGSSDSGSSGDSGGSSESGGSGKGDSAKSKPAPKSEPKASAA